MPRLTAAQWDDIRTEREVNRTPFRAIAAKYGVSAQLIQRKAKAESWGDGSDVTEVIRRKANEKAHRVVACADPKKKAAAINSAADEIAKVIERHRDEWREHAKLYLSPDIKANFDMGKSAKINAEMLTLRQKGERAAWGLEEPMFKKDPAKMTDEELDKAIKALL